MRSIFVSFWFWLLIISLLIIIIAALIVAVNKKTTNWSWALFTIGILLAVLAIIFGLIEAFWFTSCSKPCQTKYQNKCQTECPPLVYQDECAFDRMNSCKNLERTNNECSLINKCQTYSPNYVGKCSPLSTCSPTRLNINLPQAQRGFIATSNNLSSLAPSP